MAAFEDRLTALCDQATPILTGIDFIQVVTPHVQTQLRIFFVIDPDTLTVPMVTGALPQPLAPPMSVEIVSPSKGDRPLRVAVTNAVWSSFTTAGGTTRTVLDVTTAEPGGFTDYRLTIHDPAGNRVDRFFNDVLFSFKQGCPSVFDCRHPRECPPENRVDWPVDYLARDFESLRKALLEFAAQRFPRWREPIPADAATMIQELLAALGDELAYVQDRIAREGSLATVAERRSLRWHTRLVDYDIDDGESARTWLDVQVAPGVQQPVAPGTRVWAAPEGEPPIPYEIGFGLAAMTAPIPTPPFWVSAQWNVMPVHVPDPGSPCLPAGATELYLLGQFPMLASLPPGATASFWVDRPMLVRTDPTNPAEPSRRHLIHVTEIEVTSDPLFSTGGVPTPITRIAWRTEDAVPFDLCLPDTTVHGNIVPATAGETFEELFAIEDTSAAPFPIALAVERQGPLDARTRTRSSTYLFSLAATETRGLGRLSGIPEVEVVEIQPTRAPLQSWRWFKTPIDAGATDPGFTLDDGTWRRVIGFDRPQGRFEHVDRASGRGMTLRFGDGEFGAVPAPGTLFRVRYRTDVGTRPNLPADAVNVLADPNPLAPASPLTLVGVASSVSNPFAVTSGRDPERAAIVKQVAPEAFKANPRRAVRDEDYRAIAERLPWVQRGGATARWTGSWLTEFVTADPRGTVELGPDRRAELELEMDCVRQAGRPVVVRDPVYRPIDLRIRICVRPSAYEGQVIERVLAALAGRRRPGRPVPFFDPDHFTFGAPLYRASLEATIQSVPGVLAVEDMRLRARGLFDWRPFDEFVFDVGDDQILRLDNDPAHPDAGSLHVTTEALP